MDILNVILHGSFEIIGDSQCGRHQESVFKIFQGPWIFSLRQAVLEVVFRKPVSVRAQERCRQVWRCRCTWNSQSPRLPTSAAIDARRLWMMVVLVYSWLQIRLPIYAGSALKIASQKANHDLPFHFTACLVAKVQMLNLRMGGSSWHVADPSADLPTVVDRPRPEMETFRGLRIEPTKIWPTTSNYTDSISIYFILFHISRCPTLSILDR